MTLRVRKFNFPLVGWVLLFSPILIVMYSVCPMANFEAGLCAPHLDERRRRRRRAYRPLLFTIALVALGFILAQLGSVAEILAGLIVIVGLLALPFVLSVALVPQPLFRAHYSDRRYLWVAGVSPDYLQKIPDIADVAQQSNTG